MKTLAVVVIGLVAVLFPSDLLLIFALTFGLLVALDC
jgi:hypothetical protein